MDEQGKQPRMAQAERHETGADDLERAAKCARYCAARKHVAALPWQETHLHG